MNELDMAKALMSQPGGNPGQTTTVYGRASADSANGLVMVDLGGDTVSPDDDQSIECETTFKVYAGDEVIVSLIGADGSGKTPIVVGVVGRGDQQQEEIDNVKNYFWTDNRGAHVSTEAQSVRGPNILLDADSLDIRMGAGNSENQQTVYASFGREVTVGSRASGSTVGEYSQVFGHECEASGRYSHAEGWKTKASGLMGSHAEGHFTTATGYAAHAEGGSTLAEYEYAHAEGHWTIASGVGAHAEGNDTLADMHGAHSEGEGTKALGENQHVQGRYNVPDPDETYADIIGNGYYDDTEGIEIRHNAYNLDWNGNAEFQGEVYLGGCRPNGETPYPAVRYNTGEKQEEYYDGNQWKATPSGLILVTKGEITDETVVSLEFDEAGGFYLLATKEYNASTKAYRGHHLYFIVTPEEDLFGTVAVARINAAASSNAGVTVTNVADSTVQVKRSSATYAVRYALYKMGIVSGIGAPGSDPIPAYTGAYDVNPSFELQTLETQGKQMTDDVDVNAIEVSTTTNPAGGNTVYIGGEIAEI